MTSRERVIAAVEFSGPDKVPFLPTLLPASLHVFPGLENLLTKYPSDFVGEYNLSINDPRYKKGQWTDEWGCLWTTRLDGIMGQVTGHPLEDEEALKTYVWPKSADADLTGEINTAQNRGEKYVRIGNITLFERMIDLRGFEELMVDIFLENDMLTQILRYVLQYNLELIDRMLAIADVDCIAFADDWGTQLNMMISPEKWRKLFLPAYQKMFAKVKKAGKHVFFHSDGYTMPILQDLVDAGVNIFWVDMAINPAEELAAQFGGKVCFQCLADVQFTLLHSTPDEVYDYGRRLMKLFGDFNGGFIGCTEIEPDQPWENVVSIFKAFNENNTYPLT